MSDSIDWPGIRANAVHMGIRPAARAASSNLPPDEQERFVKRVLKRAEREGWEAARKAAMSSAGLPVVSRSGAAPMVMSSNVVTGQQAAINTLADLDRETKHNLASYAAEASKHAKTLKGSEALKEARNVKEVGSLGSNLFGWQGAAVECRINIFADQTKIVDAIEIESTATRCGTDVEQA